MKNIVHGVWDNLIQFSMSLEGGPLCHAATCVTWKVFFPSSVLSFMSILSAEK